MISRPSILAILCLLHVGRPFTTLKIVSRKRLTRLKEKNADGEAIQTSKLPPAVNPVAPREISAASGVATMISQQQRRVLIEELGYKRAEIDMLRVEIVAPILEKRMRRPEAGLPEEWQDKDYALRMRLEDESKYPLKVPLLGVSLILLGKGLSDLIITVVKVQMDFPGASLSDEFGGIPILAIDFACAVLGTGLGYWTLTTMKDNR